MTLIIKQYESAVFLFMTSDDTYMICLLQLKEYKSSTIEEQPLINGKCKRPLINVPTPCTSSKCFQKSGFVCAGLAQFLGDTLYSAGLAAIYNPFRFLI